MLSAGQWAKTRAYQQLGKTEPETLTTFCQRAKASQHEEALKGAGLTLDAMQALGQPVLNALLAEVGVTAVKDRVSILVHLDDDQLDAPAVGAGASVTPAPDSE